MSENKTAIVTEEMQRGRYPVIELRPNAVFPNHQGLPQSPKQQPRHRVGLAGTRRLACVTLQNAVVAGVLMFYSRSVLGAVIRACLGA
jgi:hypothetical protein